MATSGRPINLLLRTNRYFCLLSQNLFLKGGIITLAMMMVIGVNGCSISTKLGRPPLTDHLDQLTVNESTTRDIRAVLGAPQGRGATRSPSYGLKEIWLYESSEIEGTKSRMRMLMVFIDKDSGLYHGHLWFASGLMLGQTQ